MNCIVGTCKLIISSEEQIITEAIQNCRKQFLSLVKETDFNNERLIADKSVYTVLQLFTGKWAEIKNCAHEHESTES